MALGASIGASRNEFEGISRKDDNVFATIGYGYALTNSITFTLVTAIARDSPTTTRTSIATSFDRIDASTVEFRAG